MTINFSELAEKIKAESEEARTVMGECYLSDLFSNVSAALKEAARMQEENEELQKCCNSMAVKMLDAQICLVESEKDAARWREFMRICREVGGFPRFAELEARLIEQATAKKCAEICESVYPKIHTSASENSDIYFAQDRATDKCAEAIRAAFESKG